MERFIKPITDALNQALTDPTTNHVVDSAEMETPPNPEMGDFAFPCFKLAKAFRKGPPQVAQEIVKKLTEKNALPSFITATAAGPYVNFSIATQNTLSALLGNILEGKENGTYGSLPLKSRGTWVIEYSSPNIAKPFMIYHFRPTGLGACLDRVGRYRGYNIISINHLGDWGTQFGKLYVAMKLFGADLPPEPGINDLVGIYVKFHEAIEKDPSLEDQAREAFRRLEHKDPEVTASWKKCIDISMKEFERLYGKLDVHFDHYWGESHYEDQLKPLLQKLKEKEIIKESEGAWVAITQDADGRELPPAILQKSDGTSIYATRDVAAALYRYEKFHFDRMTYVVGGEQKLHFQQIFGVLRKLGCEWVSKCEHVPTGLYRFKDLKMSTRKGNSITLTEVWNMVRGRVDELMKARGHGEGLTPAEIDDIAEKVSIAAIVFHDLHADPARDVEFDVERLADFEGETGPYLQYAHTRCLSILRKAQEKGFKEVKFNEARLGKVETREEILLIKTLGQFPIYLERTLKYGKASQLAHFLIDVTKAFGAFYRECHVINDDRELTEARLMLVESTRRVLAQGLKLIGIPLPDRM